jgi:hypothetical protein
VEHNSVERSGANVLRQSLILHRQRDAQRFLGLAELSGASGSKLDRRD